MRPRLAALLCLPLLLTGCLGAFGPGGEPAAALVDAAGGQGWPPVEDALLRPGIPIGVAGVWVGPFSHETEMNGCTANFVFASPDNETLYLGTAAHCVEGVAVGEAHRLLDGAFTATLAYSSWATLRERGEGSDPEASPMRENDFALLAIRAEDRHVVHPAMLGHGGPTGLADPLQVRVGDATVMVGRSPYWARQPALEAREGCISQWSAWAFRQWWAPGVIGGDSGSPVLLGSGEALGVMIRIGGLRVNETNGVEAGNGLVTNLAPALAYAHEAGGLEVVLQTWPLLAAPASSPWPACPPGEAPLPVGGHDRTLAVPLGT